LRCVITGARFRFGRIPLDRGSVFKAGVETSDP
jgi:hypothetical protein